MHLLISVQHRFQIRTSEQGQHRQVGLAVAAVRGRVDQHHTRGRPHDIPAPQIAVQPGRRIVVVEIACPTTLDDLVDRSATVGRKPRPRGAGHRTQSLLGVELAPALMTRQRHRQRLRQRTEISGSAPTVRPHTERRRPGIMGRGQPGSELPRCRPGRRRRSQPLQRQRLRVVVHHPRTRHTTVSGRKPLQPSGFTGKEARRRANSPLDEDIHAYGWPDTIRSTRSRARVGRLLIKASCTLGPMPTT